MTIETEALQFGFKLTTEVNNLNILNLINLNYRHKDSDFNKGFVHGLLAVTTNVNTNDLALFRREIAALRNLSRNKNIFIIRDKGGGGAIMDSTLPNNKIMGLLNDKKTYKQISLQIMNKNINVFNKSNKN